MTFDDWKKDLISILKDKDLKDIELDEDLVYMAFDMEGKSPQETADEILLNRSDSNT